MSGSPTDLEHGAFSDTPPWELDPAATAWGGDVAALRTATARRLPALIRPPKVPPVRRAITVIREGTRPMLLEWQALVDESHLATAGWAFPLYVFVISLFVLPIAIAGMTLLPEGSNPDLFVLTVPLTQGQNGLTLLAFLGGFSAATSMVVVSTIALSTT